MWEPRSLKSKMPWSRTCKSDSSWPKKLDLSRTPLTRFGLLSFSFRGSDANVSKLASWQELENLKRENKLMASAFHDMAGRLQMNTVSLQRRNEPPRSWMNKVRRQLEQPAMVRSR